MAMFPILSSLVLAQITTPPPTSPAQYITQPQEIRALPGQLDKVPVVNSNSPEVVKTEGILLSTFPGTGTKFPSAHLNQPINGRFDIFSHHIARPVDPKRPLYQGFILYNPTLRPVTVEMLQAISYLNSADAPFIDLPPLVEDAVGRIFSGPGSRLMADILRGKHQSIFPDKMTIPPQQSQMLFSLPIPLSSGRSTFMRLRSSGTLYMANLAMNAIQQTAPVPNRIDGNKSPTQGSIYREPTLTEWQQFLMNAKLVEPRDLSPTSTPSSNGQYIYSRVSGISLGSEWNAKIVDRPGEKYLTIPSKGSAFSYPISTVTKATLGTEQVQSAKLLVRYPDTALEAHGNYGVLYNLMLPLSNKTPQPQKVAILIQTPFKNNVRTNALTFTPSPQGQVFFRGTVRLTYNDEAGKYQTRYFHLVQRQGQQGDPLLILNLRPGESRQVDVDFMYPPDATPPQVLTVKTLDQ